MPGKVWDEITYPFPSFNGYTVEVWEWISEFIPHCKCWSLGMDKWIHSTLYNECNYLYMLEWKLNHWKRLMRSHKITRQLWARIMLFMRQTNERGHCNVTSSLIGWAHSQDDPCLSVELWYNWWLGLASLVDSWQQMMIVCNLGGDRLMDHLHLYLNIQMNGS